MSDGTTPMQPKPLFTPDPTVRQLKFNCQFLSYRWATMTCRVHIIIIKQPNLIATYVMHTNIIILSQWLIGKYLLISTCMYVCSICWFFMSQPECPCMHTNDKMLYSINECVWKIYSLAFHSSHTCSIRSQNSQSWQRGKE